MLFAGKENPEDLFAVRMTDSISSQLTRAILFVPAAKNLCNSPSCRADHTAGVEELLAEISLIAAAGLGVYYRSQGCTFAGTIPARVATVGEIVKLFPPSDQCRERDWEAVVHDDGDVEIVDHDLGISVSPGWAPAAGKPIMTDLLRLARGLASQDVQHREQLRVAKVRTADEIESVIVIRPAEER
jgi:hypothetical protein